jgi:hypothetical protein
MPIRVVLLLVGVLCWVPSAAAQPAEVFEPEEREDGEIGPTPPRLSLVEGGVAFFRPGEPNGVPARVNLPMAPGDRLETGADGTVELEISAGGFIRAGHGTRILLVDQEPDLIRLGVEEGLVALDLFDGRSGLAVELETPNAAFTIEKEGYYRVEAGPDRTVFTVRRGGRALAVSAGSEPFGISTEEAGVIDGAGGRRAFRRPAAPRDAWDKWNEDRSAWLLEPASGRYLPPGVYGAGDLDRHGSWRTEPEYGPVWTPFETPAGWAPYSDGVWVSDPRYGWTWVDAAPWGWAPFHYGRWVHIRSRWCWAPGPVRARPVYAPAVFFSGSPGHGRPHGGGQGRDPHAGHRFLKAAGAAGAPHGKAAKTDEIPIRRHAGAGKGVATDRGDRLGRGGPLPAGFTRKDWSGLRPLPSAPPRGRSDASAPVVSNPGNRDHRGRGRPLHFEPRTAAKAEAHRRAPEERTKGEKVSRPLRAPTFPQSPGKRVAIRPAMP